MSFFVYIVRRILRLAARPDQAGFIRLCTNKIVAGRRVSGPRALVAEQPIRPNVTVGSLQ
jgi:hypothetical protein